jgi:aminocarboxymuconate-semialdehyde decarboxylase
MEPGATIRACPGLDDADRARLLGGNAEEFFAPAHDLVTTDGLVTTEGMAR